jgi:uncharacterized protein (TIGR03067 family)
MRHFPLVLASVLLIAADAKDDAVKEAKAKLKGTWDVLSLEHGGRKERATEDGKVQMVISDDRLVMQVFVKSDEDVKTELTFTIDPTQKPPHIDVVATEGPDKGKKGLGIYSLDKDELKLCIGEPGEPRPKEFVSKEGEKTVLVTLKGQKK